MTLALTSPRVTYAPGSLSTRRGELHTHTWDPASGGADAAGAARPKALVFFVHGYSSHGLYPTVAASAVHLCEKGFRCVALDLPGHGGSPGVRGLIRDEKEVVADWVEFIEHTKTQPGNAGLKMFLYGTSMGGAIALLVAAAAPEIPFLKALAWVVPSLALVPSSATDNSKQYKDPDACRLCEEDALAYKGKVRLGTGYFILTMLQRLQEEGMSACNTPFLIVHGDNDVVVDHKMSLELHRRAASQDKTIKIIAGGMHGLACETEPTRSEVNGIIDTWLEERA